MIILIGGASHTGKTNLAQRLLEKYHISYLSLDHLKMGLYRAKKDKKYHPVQDYKKLGATLWPIVKGIIMTCIENEQSMIIEGLYILPHYINDFDKKYSKEIISVFLGFSSDYIISNYDDSIKNYANISEKRFETFNESIDEYIKKNLIFKEECKKRECSYFEIGNSFKDEIEKVVEYIDNKIIAIQIK